MTTSEDIKVMLDMSREQFIAVNKEYLASLGIEFYDLTDESGTNQPIKCPLHLWVVSNHTKCAHELVGRTAYCPLCGNPCCPDCMNHHVEQLSRVTGYMGPVSGWNAAKKQEYEDRHRYEVSR